jgi:glycosyltransferase involved in cell wall biosynthesis
LSGQRAQVSFVLPAFNEGDHVKESLRRIEYSFSGYGLQPEIIVVDDGSIDATALKAWQYAKEKSNVKIISYTRNNGKGFAVKTGFSAATGEKIVLLDSDLDIDISQVERYIQALSLGDIVIGSKRHPKSEVEAPMLRCFLSRVFNMLVRLLTGLQVSDTQVGIKAFRKGAFLKVFENLSVKRYAFDVELLVLAKLCGLKIVELPVKLKVKKNFKLSEILRMAIDLLGIAYRLRIKRYYQKGLKFENFNS